MSLNLAIAGAAGRTGSRILAACAAPTSPGGPGERAASPRCTAALEACGSPHLGADAGRLATGTPWNLSITAAPEADFDVLIDFSTPAGTLTWLRECLRRERPMVIGTTGHDEAALRAIRDAAERIAVVQSPNMSVGVAVLLRAVRDVARALASGDEEVDVAIVDVHHRFKRDAPSGTALALAEAVALGRGDREDGAAAPPVSSLRIGGRAGDHAVHFGTLGETLTLAHSAHSRDVFAAGALRAARWVHGRPPGRYDMQDVLFGEPLSATSGEARARTARP